MSQRRTGARDTTTEMSHPWRRKRPSDALLVWPASCMLGCMTACYFGPIELVESNVAPVFSQSNYPANGVILVERIDQSVFVVVRDEKPQKLSYVWTLSSDGYRGDAISQQIDENYGWSELTLATKEDDLANLSGQILSCTASDGVLETRISWTLEVVR